MWKCSYLILALVPLLHYGAYAQEYDVEEPIDGDVVFKGVRSADHANLIFDDSEVVVNPGQEVALNCGVQGEYRLCFWEFGQTNYQIEDVYENTYPGLGRPMNMEGNECGIVLTSADITHHGLWTCKVLIKGGTLTGNKNVVVTIKPTRPLLEIDTSRSQLEVSNEEESEIRCSVAAARPAVNIKWYLGDRDITVHSTTEETPTDGGGIYKSVSTLRRTFDPSENNRRLICSVSHQTLNAPENESIPISVIYKPVEKPVSTYYQIAPNSDYVVRLNFSSNPAPNYIEWKYGESPENMPMSIQVPGNMDKYTAYYEEIGNGHYTAVLEITGFAEEDVKQSYALMVRNTVGETQYQVRLSMDEAPLDALGGGAVAGIIIVVLIVVVAVVAAGYARYRQMFCFAPAAVTKDPEEGKDIKEEHSDTESARGPNTTRAANLKNSIGKLTQVFKKPKKEQETKLEEHIGDDEKKYLTKEESKKDSPKEQHDEKEVVYAELDLSKGDLDKKAELKTEEKTEYAQIIGTVTDNREEEKKE